MTSVVTANQRESRQRFEAEPLADFINAMTAGGRALVVAEHDEIRKKERHISFFMANKDVSTEPGTW